MELNLGFGSFCLLIRTTDGELTGAGDLGKEILGTLIGIGLNVGVLGLGV
jgi:hypothetical protein